MSSSLHLRALAATLLLSAAGLAAHAQTPRNEAPVSAAAPTDQPLALASTEAGASLREFDRLIAPAVKQARKTLPHAKKRFLAGLPAGQAFFLTTRIFDSNGNYEQVFIRVKDWSGTTVQGLISSELNLVQQYQAGQLIRFPEKAILDWTIATPDGGEEGNFVGKFIDSLQH
ncbi:DUF2314 domain-containing protein [Hymenobacter amundsenii]|nr:DUF2314 domain-containing protein [Hymenobacter amundsenii]